MNYEEAIHSLQDTLVVMAEIQRRQAEVQKSQAAELDAVRERCFAQEKWAERTQKWAERMQAWAERMQKWSDDFSQRMLEIGDKLDGLIGYVDRLPKQPPPPQ